MKKEEKKAWERAHLDVFTEAWSSQIEENDCWSRLQFASKTFEQLFTGYYLAATKDRVIWAKIFLNKIINNNGFSLKKTHWERILKNSNPYSFYHDLALRKLLEIFRKNGSLNDWSMLRAALPAWHFAYPEVEDRHRKILVRVTLSKKRIAKI